MVRKTGKSVKIPGRSPITVLLDNPCCFSAMQPNLPSHVAQLGSQAAKSQESSEKVAAKSRESSRKVAAKSQESSKLQPSRKKVAGKSQLSRKKVAGKSQLSRKKVAIRR